MSIANTILESDDIVKKPVKVEQWNFDGFVQEMSMGDFKKYINFIQALSSYGEDKEDLSDSDELLLQAYTVCLTLRNTEGDKVFKESEYKKLSKKNSVAIAMIAKDALEISNLSAFNGEDVEKK
jgi:hypothetical protein